MAVGVSMVPKRSCVVVPAVILVAGMLVGLLDLTIVLGSAVVVVGSTEVVDVASIILELVIIGVIVEEFFVFVTVLVV